jgi:hypothetical protein
VMGCQNNGGCCIRRLLASIPHYHPARSPCECAASRAIKPSRMGRGGRDARSPSPSRVAAPGPSGHGGRGGGVAASPLVTYIAASPLLFHRPGSNALHDGLVEIDGRSFPS